MLRFPVRPFTKADLKERSEPQAVRGGQLEAIALPLYDTGTYTSATTTQITFFTTARGSRNLSNLDTPGILSDPQYFLIDYMGLDILTPPGDGAWLDVHRLLSGDTVANGGPYWEFSLQGKSYGQIPLTFMHESGGVRGYGFSTATADTVEVGRNALPDGGWCVDGSILIPPMAGFQVEIVWPNAVTLATSPVAIRPWLAGTLYRKVL